MKMYKHIMEKPKYAGIEFEYTLVIVLVFLICYMLFTFLGLLNFQIMSVVIPVIVFIVSYGVVVYMNKKYPIKKLKVVWAAKFQEKKITGVNKNVFKKL